MYYHQMPPFTLFFPKNKIGTLHESNKNWVNQTPILEKIQTPTLLMFKLHTPTLLIFLLTMCI